MEASRAQLRRSAAIRVGVSVLVAGGVTALLIFALWGPLDIKTDVIGLPTFSDFNYENYFRAYYLTVVLFPLLAIGIFFALTRFGDRIGLAKTQRAEPFRPRSLPEEQRPRLPGVVPLAEQDGPRRLATLAGRIGLTGFVLGLELAVAINNNRNGIAIGIVAYALLALLAAAALGAWRRQWSLPARLAAVNTLAAAVCLAGLLAVSLSTYVQIVSTGGSVDYPWLPAWLILPLAAAAAALLATKLRAAGEEARVFAIERRTLLCLVAPVGLLLTLQLMPGDLVDIDYFHGGEQVVGARLFESGFFPWRDMVLTHGMLQDVIYDLGRGLFAGGLWGHVASVSMIMKPLYLISVFLLLVYLVGRNWLFLLFGALLMIGPYVAPEQFRLILWPLILLLLAADLDRPARLKEIGIAFLLVAQAMLTPEAGPAIVAVAAVLIAYEWYWREPGSSFITSFRRTIWVGIGGVAFAALVAGFLAANHALDDYLYVSIYILHGHAQSGAGPPYASPDTISLFALWIFGLMPPAALLVSTAYGFSRLWQRRPIYTQDWVMAAAAIFVFFYYPKFLSRMDTGHVYQVFVAALPLVFYIVYRWVAWIEEWLSRRGPLDPLLRLTSHPLSFAIVVATLAISWPTYHSRVKYTSNAYRPVVAKPIRFKKVGYSATFPYTAYSDLNKVINSYLGPRDRLFDFSNSPLLFFYLIDRLPSTRYFHVSFTFSAKLQANQIDYLKKSQPKLVVFDNDSDPFIGLSNWDGISNMVRSYDLAQWILDRYKPLLWSHGITIYARRDQPPASQSRLNLKVPPVTTGVPFTVQPCGWGYSPNFLTGPGTPGARAPAVGAHLRSGSQQVDVIGWAGDPDTRQPVPEVIVTADGKVVGRARPTLSRPDLVAYGLPEGFRNAGFDMHVSVPRGARIQIYAKAQSGGLTELVAQDDRPDKGTAEIGGSQVKLDPSAVQGQINEQTREDVSRFELPAGAQWSDYRWLEVDAGPKGFSRDTMTVYDDPSRPRAEREISFQTLPNSPRQYMVPVGSCAQWHAYRTPALYLNSLEGQQIKAVRLIK